MNFERPKKKEEVDTGTILAMIGFLMMGLIPIGSFITVVYFWSHGYILPDALWETVKAMFDALAVAVGFIVVGLFWTPIKSMFKFK